MCTGVHETLENAADEVPQPTKTRVLMRKARRADVYWSTLGPAERSASGSATLRLGVDDRKVVAVAVVLLA